MLRREVIVLFKSIAYGNALPCYYLQIPKDKAEMMRALRQERAKKLVKCEVYLKKRGLKANKKKLAEFVESIGGTYNPTE